MSAAPGVTVLLPVYNTRHFVRDAVLSILNQEYRDIECLIIDDGSTDGSGEILEKLAAEDGRVRLVRRENLGLVATLNQGLKMAKAPLIARMDSDDISLLGRLGKQKKTLDDNPNIIALGGGIRYIAASGRPGRTVRYPQGQAVGGHLFWGSPFAHPAVMFRREAVLRAGGYRPMFRHCEDYDLWLRLSRAGRLENLPDTVLLYRVHEDSVSRRWAWEQRRGSLAAQAAWLIAQRRERDPFAEPGARAHIPDFSRPFGMEGVFPWPLSLLPEWELRSLVARMLSLNVAALGDEREDAESGAWLGFVKKGRLSGDDRYALSLYHARCARLYRRCQPLRAARHVARSLALTPRPWCALAGKFFVR